MQLQLYPANLTKEQFAAGGQAICYLPFALSPFVSQKVNGDWSLKFDYPAAWAAPLKTDMLVLADGQLYRILEVEPNGVNVSIRALHIFYDLRDSMITNIETAETTPGGVNQKTALQQVLHGTPFDAGTVDTDLLLDYLDILQKDVVSAIKEQILGLWGGELQPDNWTIHIRKRIGADRGVQLRHGKNINGVRYSESLDGVITRLHILGYKNANIESINDGKDYIDSPHIGLYANIKEGLVTFGDDDLPEDLLSKGQEYLATVDTPRIQVSVDMAKVVTSVQYQHYRDLERVELGDTVRVFHPLGIDIETRVVSREYNPVTGENSRVEYSNESKNLYSSIASAQQASEIIKMITDRKGHIRGEKLRGMVDLLTTRLYASGSYNTAEVRENEGVLLENTDESSVDYGAIFIGPGIIAIADERNNGSWIWRTFGTGKGFVADEIVAGTLQAGLVKILGTEQFYWDAGNIVVQDPTNPLHQIRFGRYDGEHYGLAFTKDGGNTWSAAFGFDGFNLQLSTISVDNVEGLPEVLDGIIDDIAGTNNVLDTLNAGQMERLSQINSAISQLNGAMLTAQSDISNGNAAQEYAIAQINAAIALLTAEANSIKSGVAGLQANKVTTDQYIRMGLLYVDDNGIPRYGVAIGENLTTVTDGQGRVVLERRALATTITSDRISFWRNGRETLYISEDKVVIIRLAMGPWEMNTDYGWTLLYKGVS